MRLSRGSSRRLFAGALVLALLFVGCLAAWAAERREAAPDGGGSVDAGAPGPPGGPRLVAALPQWRIYERGYLVRDVATSGAAARLTHLHYSFANVSADGRCFESNADGQGDAWADYQRPFSAAESVDGVGDRDGQRLSGNFNQLRKLKAAYPRLKVVLSLGGWSWSKYLSNAALTAASRRALAQSCIRLFLAGDLPRLEGQQEGGAGAGAGVFDGIDVDWEWPGSGGEEGNVHRPVDRRNFTLLLAELRSQLDAFGRRAGRHYSLSAVLPADAEQVRAGFEPDRIFGYLDYATVLAFDLHGPWDDHTGFPAPLRTSPADPGPDRLSVTSAIEGWLAGGAPAEKLLVAAPAFGRGWRGVPATGDGRYQRAAGPAPGGYEPGAEDYRVLAARPGRRFRDREAGALWLYDGDQWWSYDDPAVMREKAAFVRQHGLGGAFMWSLDGDDARGSLVAALHAGLTGRT